MLIPGRPPTPNVRRDRWQVASDNKLWRNAAKLLALDAVNRSRWVAPQRVRLTVTFLIPSTARRRDLDNLIAATKPLTDGLVDARAISDDSLNVVESMAFHVRVSPGYTGTEYVVEPAEGMMGLGL